MTTKQANDMNRNPTGKGGFQERPEDRSNGRWKAEDSISYQYNKLMRMSPEEFEKYEPETIAQEIAYKRITTARTSVGLLDTKEITDRTEGKAPQSLDLTSKGESVNPFGGLTVEELKKLAGK